MEIIYSSGEKIVSQLDRQLSAKTGQPICVQFVFRKYMVTFEPQLSGCSENIQIRYIQTKEDTSKERKADNQSFIKRNTCSYSKFHFSKKCSCTVSDKNGQTQMCHHLKQGTLEETKALAPNPKTNSNTFYITTQTAVDINTSSGDTHGDRRDAGGYSGVEMERQSDI